jgi:hypothetical protein
VVVVVAVGAGFKPARIIRPIICPHHLSKSSSKSFVRIIIPRIFVRIIYILPHIT